MNTAVYPGTFDPITNGHTDIISRASKLFDKTIVAVAASARKAPDFDLDRRLKMVQDCFTDAKNIEVKVLDCLLVDFAMNENANIILRGLRAVSDFDYEFQLAGMNRCMQPKLETIFLPAMEDKAFISATMVKEIARLGGDVSKFVPAGVVDALK